MRKIGPEVVEVQIGLGGDPQQPGDDSGEPTRMRAPHPLLTRLSALVHGAGWPLATLIAGALAGSVLAVAAAAVAALVAPDASILHAALLAGVAGALGAAVPAGLLFAMLDEVVRTRARLEEEIRRRRVVEFRLRRLADTDDLTGLLNRRAFFERARGVVALARRYGHAVALAMIDIDRFKAINDRYGHAAGDQALREVAEALRRELRGSDLAARFGGDEFVVLMPLTGLEGARRVAERIRQQLAQRSRRRITISIGLASASGDDIDLEELVTRSDRMLYAAKEAGRDSIQPPPAGSTSGSS